MIVDNEKIEADRLLETMRIRNEDLRRKYEQLMMDNNHRIHVQEHMHEINEMKRLTGSMSFAHDYSF
jgi:predicted metal-dependent hydrolase